MSELPITPNPPESLLQIEDRFEPAPELEQWFRSYFINPDARYFNKDHEHLQRATIGVLWTNAKNDRAGQVIAGTAELARFGGGKWQQARQECQIKNWFGLLPDFIITFSIWCWINANVWSRMATSEHELYHCGQARDSHGDLRYNKDDIPIWFLKPHDAEEHIGVVRRYGPGNAAGGVLELVKAAMNAPEIAPASNVGMCGTCKRMILSPTRATG